MYNISYKTLIGPKLMDLFRVYDGVRYLVLFGPEKYAIYNRIRYLIS